jgi:hypothetical protein
LTPGVSAAVAPVAESPRISVIVPSLNSGAFLREALSSALDQVGMTFRPGPTPERAVML